MTAEEQRSARVSEPQGQLAALGTLSGRAAMGDGPRGLLGHWRVLELFSARPRPQPRLSLGRGRPAGHLRSRVPALLCAGAVERQGPDPQGAALRPDRPRGKSRRGREGDLFLPRFVADAFVPARRFTSIRRRPFPTTGWSTRTAAAASSIREFELVDTGIFDDNRYFDVFAEYAKANTDDILIRITVANRGPEAATLHLLPTLWFRNTWSWGCTHEGCEIKPRIDMDADGGLRASHATLGTFRFFAEPMPDGEAPPFLFTENETNFERLFKLANARRPVKDAFHDFVDRRQEGRGQARDPSAPRPRRTTCSSVPAGGEIGRSACGCSPRTRRRPTPLRRRVRPRLRAAHPRDG